MGEDRSAAPWSWIIKRLKTASCESYVIVMQLVWGATSYILVDLPVHFLVHYSDKLLPDLVANWLVVTIYVCIGACVFVSQRCIFAVHMYRNVHFVIISGYYSILVLILFSSLNMPISEKNIKPLWEGLLGVRSSVGQKYWCQNE